VQRCRQEVRNNVMTDMPVTGSRAALRKLGVAVAPVGPMVDDSPLGVAKSIHRSHDGRAHWTRMRLGCIDAVEREVRIGSRSNLAVE
jgi:hypothetical protein